jgi:hypothetical protein
MSILGSINSVHRLGSNQASPQHINEAKRFKSEMNGLRSTQLGAHIRSTLMGLNQNLKSYDP